MVKKKCLLCTHTPMSCTWKAFLFTAFFYLVWPALFQVTMVERRSYGSSTTSRLGWWFKGENYGKGRWTQTQLHMRQDKGNKRRAFIKQKLNAKKNRQNGTTGKVEKQNQQNKVATKQNSKTKYKSKIKVQLKHGELKTKTYQTGDRSSNRSMDIRRRTKLLTHREAALLPQRWFTYSPLLVIHTEPSSAAQMQTTV